MKLVAEAIAQKIFDTMWKPYNALLETKFYFIGYLGFLVFWAIGFVFVLAYSGVRWVFRRSEI